MSERQYVLFGILALIIGILVGVYTTIGNKLSTEGAVLQNLQAETARVKKDNLMVKEQLLHEEALTTIEEKARAKGFQEIKKYIYL